MILFSPAIILGQGLTKEDYQEVIDTYSSKFSANDFKLYAYFQNYEYIPKTEIKLNDYLIYLLELGNKGDEKCKILLLQHLQELYIALKEKNLTNVFLFDGLMNILKKVNPGEDVFELSMLLFQDERNYVEELMTYTKKKKIHIGDTPNSHYGLLAYRNLIVPMISKNQYSKIYQPEYSKILLDHILEYDDGSITASDLIFKKIHKIWYKRIKADWEAEKIKLRNSKD